MARRERRRAGRPAMYALCSLALQYPDGELLAGRDEILDAVAKLPDEPAATALRSFWGWWTTTPALELEQHYVETFDLQKRSGLYMTFYALGDKRERGMALLRLKKLYRAAGLPMEGSSELPDYLPVMLEFAAAAPSGYGEVVLREHRSALELVRLSLREDGSRYAQVLDAVCLLAGELVPADRLGLERLITGGPPQELVGLEPFAPPEVVPATGARR